MHRLREFETVAVTLPEDGLLRDATFKCHVVAIASCTPTTRMPDRRDGRGDPRTRAVLHHEAVRRGHGLGLSTVHGIVSSLGGYLSIDSQAGAGTTVSAHVPARSAPIPLPV